VLLDQLDPLSARDLPEPHARYPEYAHEVYNLLARGASDTQIGRRLHQAESGELNHPELATRDLTALLRSLRAIRKENLSAARGASRRSPSAINGNSKAIQLPLVLLLRRLVIESAATRP